jgi:hypothetical protein
MFTGSFPTLSSRSADASLRHTKRIVSRLSLWTRHTMCGMHGHELLLHFERTRVTLQCANCGYQTTGWNIDRNIR